MGKYSNVGKILKITYIDSQKMRLQDESKWRFLKDMRPPSVWKVGDTVKPDTLPSFKSDSMFAIYGVSQKDTNTQAEYLGGAKGESTDINVTKSMTDREYPANNMDRSWRVKKAAGNIVVLEDGSVWKLTAALSLNMNSRALSNWQEGHYATVSRTIGKSHDIRNYQVKNNDTGVTLIGTFEGWES